MGAEEGRITKRLRRLVRKNYTGTSRARRTCPCRCPSTWSSWSAVSSSSSSQLGDAHGQGSAGGGLEDLADTVTRLGRALDVALGANLLGDSKTLLARDGTLVHAGKVLDGLGVVAQVLLASNENDGEAVAEVEHLRDPLRRLVKHASKGPAFSWTLSSESGESIAKQMRMTCESGYERGRRRLVCERAALVAASGMTHS